MYSLAEQANAFGLMVIAGVIVGLLFDLYRVCRGRIFPGGAVATFIGDLVFTFLAAIIIYGSLLIGSWGEFRFHLLAGACSGLFFYFAVFSRPILRLLVWLLKVLLRGKNLMSAGTKNLCYQGVNLGVGWGRKVGLDKLMRKWRPKRRNSGLDIKQERPQIGKRLNRATRIFSARSRNFMRYLGRGIQRHS